MPPKAKDGGGDGMLEYLEEIAGSNKFVEPIKAAETIVEGLGERRLEAHKRCKAAEGDMTGLESAKLQAMSYLTAERDVLRHKWALAHVRAVGIAIVIVWRRGVCCFERVMICCVLA